MVISNIKISLSKIPHIMKFYRKVDALFSTLIFDLSPKLLAKYNYLRLCGHLPNFENPQTFDEKLLWLMLFWQHPLKTKCADKYDLRLYVEDNRLGHLLPELLGVYDKSSEIDFTSLPSRFVLKCTHGCGFNIFCKDKRTFDCMQARHKLDKWLRIDISKLSGEIHYAAIKPRIICESFLGEENGTCPVDYKLYCFDGRVHCTLVCTERETGNSQFDIFDREWQTKLPYRKSNLCDARTIFKPSAYDDMLMAAEKLSKPFPFVRIDFYSIKGRAVIGEMTFTPHGCINTDYTDLAQRELGALIRLPGKWVKQ